MNKAASGRRTIRAELEAAWMARTLVRVWRSGVDEHHVDARVEAVARKLVAFAVVGDGIRPNGIEVYRVADVTRVERPAPYADFVRSALQLRGERLMTLGRVDTSSWRALVETAGKRFALLTFYIEEKKPDVCYIGRAIETTARGCTLMTIAPDATWDSDDLLTLAWRDVTRVDFGGAYEEALALVAARERPRGG